jgi:hypothetical protein
MTHGDEVTMISRNNKRAMKAYSYGIHDVGNLEITLQLGCAGQPLQCRKLSTRQRHKPIQIYCVYRIGHGWLDSLKTGSSRKFGIPKRPKSKSASVRDIAPSERPCIYMVFTEHLLRMTSRTQFQYIVDRAKSMNSATLNASQLLWADVSLDYHPKA